MELTEWQKEVRAVLADIDRITGELAAETLRVAELERNEARD
jgi:hypothetical protein